MTSLGVGGVCRPELGDLIVDEVGKNGGGYIFDAFSLNSMDKKFVWAGEIKISLD
ncbi:MAG: hypothetical protein ACPL07_00615 [Candidatus Bathyarchaeia archaeon]